MMAGFALAGIGIILIGVGAGTYYNTAVGGFLGSNFYQFYHELGNAVNTTFLGWDLAGIGVVVGGLGAGLNVAARFDQAAALGRPPK